MMVFLLAVLHTNLRGMGMGSGSVFHFDWFGWYGLIISESSRRVCRQVSELSWTWQRKNQRWEKISWKGDKTAIETPASCQGKDHYWATISVTLCKEKQRDRGKSSRTSLGKLAGNGKGERREKDFSEGYIEEAINHRVKRSTTTVTAESRGVKADPFFSHSAEGNLPVM